MDKQQLKEKIRQLEKHIKKLEIENETLRFEQDMNNRPIIYPRGYN